MTNPIHRLEQNQCLRQLFFARLVQRQCIKSIWFAGVLVQHQKRAPPPTTSQQQSDFPRCAQPSHLTLSSDPARYHFMPAQFTAQHCELHSVFVRSLCLCVLERVDAILMRRGRFTNDFVSMARYNVLGCFDSMNNSTFINK